MRKITNCICNKANHFINRARMAVSNQRGDFYISDAVSACHGRTALSVGLLPDVKKSRWCTSCCLLFP